MKKNKGDKPAFIDDGHTIYDMNVDAPWAKNKKEEPVLVTKEEQKTLMKAVFRTYFPKLLLVLGSFALAIILIYLWLN